MLLLTPSEDATWSHCISRLIKSSGNESDQKRTSLLAYNGVKNNSIPTTLSWSAIKGLQGLHFNYTVSPTPVMRVSVCISPSGRIDPSLSFLTCWKTEMIKMEVRSIIVTALLVYGAAVVAAAGESATLSEKCSNDFEKVAMCLTYATGKAETPSKECCSSVTDIKENDPVCLCYIIQQAHNGSAQIKSMGIQEARLLQLPSACRLTNASISDCPKLLNIPASSPDYAIFTNSTASKVTPSSSAGTSPSMAEGSSGWRVNGPRVVGLIAVAFTVFSAALPVGFISISTC